ncbi:glycosyltransferase [Oceanobacillus jordanicus]|uniref:Glycosyltransferase n=1 Tax=Oceanobacillus jordanicus TaxID=2867266 RepID=A0AAW5B0Z1_9BACI|nr:glycosyltransferase [Oceanobacillus jordanicus]MCG3418161.1 glycosyltransferase [Oceanobacillus jordanicus]
MKILVISHMYPSKANYINGIFVHEQIKELIKLGQEVVVVSPVPYVPSILRSSSKKWSNYSSIPPKDNIEGVEVYYPRYVALPRNANFDSSGKRMYISIQNTIKKIRRDFRFDIIHAHVALPDGYAATLVAKRYNVPLITTIHGQDFQHTIHKNVKCKRKVKEVLEESNINILVSNKLNSIRKQFLAEIDSTKFTVINNGVSNMFLEGSSMQQKNATDKGSNVQILSVSNLLKPKGIDLCLRAISKIVEKHPGITYQIIGDGQEKAILEQLVKKLNLEENVVFLGKKSRKDVKEFMTEADIFLLPSWNEAFGVVYIEAMACGTPVIGCKGEGIEDIVDNGIDGLLVEPKSVEDITEKTLYLINNSKYRKIIGNNAIKKIKDNFAWKEVSLKILAEYQKATVNKTKN